MSSPTDILIQVPSSGEGETIYVVVTVVNGQFYFDGQAQTDFKLIEGNTYIFQQSGTNGNGHVLGISEIDGGTLLPDLIFEYQ